MPGNPTEGAPGKWSVPQCPFTIHYALEVMDDIRLAVMDAFFSLPRGGAEIGGVLLGRHSASDVSVDGYLPLECEHATGPSFVLSLSDEKRLEELVNQGRKRPDGLVPVGWYHSHTRSEIFLSDIDQELHRRFFPDPWQVALVFKPHTFQPMRCGFFFREADGSIHATATYQEFTLEPMPVRQMPSDAPPLVHGAAAGGTLHDHDPPRQVLQFSAAPDETFQRPAAADAPPASVEAPKFATVAHETRPWGKVAVFLAVGLGLGALYQSRQMWLPKLIPAAGAAAPVSLGLTTQDAAGQLQIHWDRSAVQQAQSGVLTLTDAGKPPKAISLDNDHLRSGVFTYAREGEQVDVVLAVDQAGGTPLRSATAFVGKIPEKPVIPPDDETPRLKADLAAKEEKLQKVESQLNDEMSQAAKLRQDLAAQTDRARRAEQKLSEANDRIQRLDEELKQQQRKRLGAQDPGKQR